MANPVPFGAPDGQQTDLFFLLGCHEDRLHLHTLARLCMICQKTDVLHTLREAQTAEDAWQALVDAEKQAVPET